MKQRSEWRSRSSARLMMAGLMAAALLMSAHAGAAQTPAANPAAAPPGNVENGKKQYLVKGCWTCHDYEAQGGNGPRLVSTALPFKNFTAYVRAPRGGMPPYLVKIISDAEMADLYAFLQAAAKPKPSKDIPLLQP